MAQRAQQRAQVINVTELSGVPVLRHPVLDGAAVGNDIRTVLRERPPHVFEQPRPVPRLDRDLHAEARPRAPLPLDRREPFGVAHQRLHVGTVGPVDRDPTPEGDVPPDIVARHRRAALGEPKQHVVDPLHDDPEALARHR